MTALRTGTHQELAIDELVAIAVVGEGENLLQRPGPCQIGHAHTVRSAVIRKQGGDTPPRWKEPHDRVSLAAERACFVRSQTKVDPRLEYRAIVHVVMASRRAASL